MSELFEAMDREYSACRSEVKKTMGDLNFEHYHTGGGCTAWAWFSDTKACYVLIENDQSIDGDPHEQSWGVGFYNDDGAFFSFRGMAQLSSVR